MPAKSRWLLQVPAIIERLAALDVPVLDRRTCERVFGVGRRRAIYLMQRLGGYQAGNVVLVDRLAAIEQLKRIAAGDEIIEERRRKDHLAARLEEVSRYRSAAAVHIPISPHAMDRSFPDLPEGVCLADGKLVAEYASAEQLLQRLFEIAQAAANDYESFRATVEATNPAAEKST